jgi:hypothetical protein
MAAAVSSSRHTAVTALDISSVVRVENPLMVNKKSGQVGWREITLKEMAAEDQVRRFSRRELCLSERL